MSWLMQENFAKRLRVCLMSTPSLGNKSATPSLQGVWGQSALVVHVQRAGRVHLLRLLHGRLPSGQGHAPANCGARTEAHADCAHRRLPPHQGHARCEAVVHVAISAWVPNQTGHGNKDGLSHGLSCHVQGLAVQHAAARGVLSHKVCHLQG